MILNKFKRKAMSAALAGVMGLSMCSPVLAMAAEGDAANSNITIEAEATSINVTVPTNAAFVFKGDGTNVYPSNYEVTNNNALTAITLNSIDFEGVNGWKLTTEDDTFQADQKKFALWMGARGNELSAVDVEDGVIFADETEIKIAPNGSKVLDFEAKRGVFSSPVTTENAMQMTMHFDWEQAPARELRAIVYRGEAAGDGSVERPYSFDSSTTVDENTKKFMFTMYGYYFSSTPFTLTFNGTEYTINDPIGSFDPYGSSWMQKDPGMYKTSEHLGFIGSYADLPAGEYPVILKVGASGNETHYAGKLVIS